jgi:hypothetical protein
MALMRVRDRKLFTAAEWALLRSSAPSRIKALTAARLKDLIGRARRMTDKYRDLARRQLRDRKRRTGMGTFPERQARTQRKARLLGEAAGRFETCLKRLERGVRRTPRLPARPPRPARPATAVQREALRREQQRRQAAAQGARAVGVTKQFQQSRLRTIQAHLRSAGKRRQGRRDSRR